MRTNTDRNEKGKLEEVLPFWFGFADQAMVLPSEEFGSSCEATAHTNRCISAPLSLCSLGICYHNSIFLANEIATKKNAGERPLTVGFTAFLHILCHSIHQIQIRMETYQSLEVSFPYNVQPNQLKREVNGKQLPLHSIFQ